MQGAGYKVQGAGCRVQGAECRVQGAGCRVQSAGCRVHGDRVGCATKDLSENSKTESCTDRYISQFENNYLAEMCSGS